LTGCSPIKHGVKGEGDTSKSCSKTKQLYLDETFNNLFRTAVGLDPGSSKHPGYRVEPGMTKTTKPPEGGFGKTIGI